MGKGKAPKRFPFVRYLLYRSDTRSFPKEFGCFVNLCPATVRSENFTVPVYYVEA